MSFFFFFFAIAMTPLYCHGVCVKTPAAQWEYSCERAGTVGSCLFRKSSSADHSSRQQYCELHYALLLA